MTCLTRIPLGLLTFLESVRQSPVQQIKAWHEDLSHAETMMDGGMRTLVHFMMNTPDPLTCVPAPSFLALSSHCPACPNTGEGYAPDQAEGWIGYFQSV